MNNTMEANDDEESFLTKGFLAGLIAGVVVLSVTIWLGIDFFFFHRVQARKKERKLHNFYTSLEKSRILGYNAIDVTQKEDPEGGRSKAKKSGKFNKILTFLKIRKSDDDEVPKKKIRRSQSVGLPHNTPTAGGNNGGNGISPATMTRGHNNQNKIDNIKEDTRPMYGTGASLSRQNMVGPIDEQRDNRHHLPPLSETNERRPKPKTIFSLGVDEELVLQSESERRKAKNESVLKQIYSQIPRGGPVYNAFEFDNHDNINQQADSVMNFARKNDSSKSDS